MKPDRWVKFNTSLGPIYVDLEEVSSVLAGENVAGFKMMTVYLKGGNSLNLNPTFYSDMTRIMDAWMEWKNQQ